MCVCIVYNNVISGVAFHTLFFLLLDSDIIRCHFYTCRDSTALKGTQFYTLFVFTAACLVSFGGRET